MEEKQKPFTGRGIRMNNTQRMWVFWYLAQARALEQDESVSYTVYRKLCQLLEDNKEKHHLPEPPCIKAVKNLYKKACESGTIVASKSTGRRPKPCREEIEFLVNTTDLSTRQIAKKIGVASRETVRRTIKNLDKLAKKQAKLHQTNEKEQSEQSPKQVNQNLIPGKFKDSNITLFKNVVKNNKNKDISRIS